MTMNNNLSRQLFDNSNVSTQQTISCQLSAESNRENNDTLSPFNDYQIALVIQHHIVIVLCLHLICILLQ